MPGCLLARAGIRGSGYCEPHHFERFRDKLETPKLLEFMQNTEYLKHFRAAIEGRPNLMSLLQFWLAVEDFKTISNRSLLPQRADGIMSRFFSESAEGGSLLGTELAEEKVAAARALLLDRARAGVFAALQVRLKPRHARARCAHLRATGTAALHRRRMRSRSWTRSSTPTLLALRTSRPTHATLGWRAFWTRRAKFGHAKPPCRWRPAHTTTCNWARSCRCCKAP